MSVPFLLSRHPCIKYLEPMHAEAKDVLNRSEPESANKMFHLSKTITHYRFQQPVKSTNTNFALLSRKLRVFFQLDNAV